MASVDPSEEDSGEGTRKSPKLGLFLSVVLCLAGAGLGFFFYIQWVCILESRWN